MAQNTTSNRGYDDTVYIPRQQRLRPMILTRKVQQFYLVYPMAAKCRSPLI